MKAAVLISLVVLFTKDTESQPCAYTMVQEWFPIIPRATAISYCEPSASATSSMLMIKNSQQFNEVVSFLDGEIGSVKVSFWLGAKPYSSSRGWRWLDDERIPPEDNGFPRWYIRNLKNNDVLILTTDTPGNPRNRYFFRNVRNSYTTDGIFCGTVPTGVDNPCTSSPCLHGSTCTNVGCHFQCQCTATTSGSTCDICLLDDPCTNEVCFNGGTCIRDRCTTQFSCVCKFGYAGRYCQSCASDPCATSVCQNGGTCIRDEDCVNSYSCDCVLGYGGLHCETCMPECSICRDHSPGNDTSYLNIMYCRFKQFKMDSAGLSMRTPVCVVKPCFSSKCENGGTCIPSPYCSYNYTCNCPYGYEGTYCEKCIWDSPCESIICEYGGICVTNSSCTPNFTCSCTPFFSGEFCNVVDFLLLNGSYDCTYHFRHNVIQQSNYSTASRICHQFNATLAMIQNADKQQLLSNAGLSLIDNIDLYFWLGAERFNDTWKWLDHSIIPLTNINGFPQWGKDQPESEENRNHIFISSFWEFSGVQTSSAQSFYWSNMNESFEIGWICEKPLGDAACLTFPCKNGGSCTSVGCSYYCLCAGKYVGRNCELLAPEFTRISPDSQTTILTNDFTLLCQARGIPVPMVTWTLLQGNVSQDILVEMGSPFRIENNFTKNETASFVEISSLGLCLGSSSIRCIASNGIPDTDISHAFNINPGSYEPFQTSYYIFSSDLKVNASTAKHHCNRLAAKLVSVVDNKTQEFLIKEIEKQLAEGLWSSEDTWIGLMRSGTAEFTWENNKKLHYTNWDRGQPINTYDCTYMGEGSKWKNSPCSNAVFLAHYVCEKEDRILPVITSLESPFGSGETSSVIVEFGTPQAYFNFNHRVEATKNASTEFEEVVPGNMHLPNETVFVAVSNLEPKVEYEIKVSVASEFCSKPIAVSSFIKTSPSNTVDARVINEKTCLIAWTWPSAKLYEVWYFILTITKHPFAYTNVSKDHVIDVISKESFSANLSSGARQFSFPAMPNRNHIIHVFAKSDPGNDTSSFAPGTCLAPLRVIAKAPQPLISGGSGSLVTLILSPFDEVDGPISCYFLVMVYFNEFVEYKDPFILNSFFDEEIKSPEINVSAGTEYIALALRSDFPGTSLFAAANSPLSTRRRLSCSYSLSRNNLSRQINRQNKVHYATHPSSFNSKGSRILLSLGDDRNMSCDIFDFVKDNGTIRAKRSLNRTNIYEARNFPLVSNKYYVFYTIATVLSENDQIKVVRSELVVRYINLEPVPIWIIAIGMSGILFIGLTITILVLQIRKYRANKKADLLLDDIDIPTENFDVLQEDMKKHILSKQEYTIIKFLKKTDNISLVEVFLHSKHHRDVTGIGKMVSGSKLTPRQRQNFAIEVEVLKIIGKHDFVVHMYGLAVASDMITVVFQYGSAGPLSSFLVSKKPSPTSKGRSSGEADELDVGTMLKFSWQIAKGMDHIAELGLVHRALCCGKIYLSNNFQCLISDFSVARKVKESDGRYVNHDLKVTYLTRQWMAPEAYYENIYSSASDAYSFGVVMWEIFAYGCTPVERKHSSDFRKSKLEKPAYCPDGVFDMMERCWHVIPTFRPKFPELHHKLKSTIHHNYTNVSPVYDNIKYLESLYDNEYGNANDDDDSDIYMPVYDSILELKQIYSSA